ncbi:hypothetical protein SPRG_19962 [Saprolegnia parasitica CBS 223.65]|uniref:Calcineurin-like phosphoesterase domain-containing protein n=1 Tax=Saprolegnia parasitica (strain CBS 223.65) TaxID=695850 RepID=A0A067CE50_SAPPC|nr:hypothetical protein SPRG_19962 [Saprolegnia parasitica CBS 223.65]KDO28748.1 hypothetical protein SPRG_19962 [Saprolegnia parasitica CBS 223.65]|eukprot:XP_012200495.1 hypothetical protein SPRG_19962 [Saprolegnia parasitica CBS 223.65]
MTMTMHARAIADVQYADVDDAWNYTKTSKRYYRDARRHLEAAVDAWLLEATTRPLRFVVNLGDLLDGKNAALGQSESSLALLRGSLERFQDRVGPVHHCIGNHELYNFTRDEYLRLLVHRTSSRALPSSLPPPATTVAYYSFTIPEAPSYVFAILDPYDTSVLGSRPGSAEHSACKEFLRQRNPNEDLNSSDHLDGPARRFVEYNGGIGASQLQWLDALLEAADAKRQQVVLFSHVPLHPDSCHMACLLWNYDEILRLLQAHASVKAVLSGHCHENGYTQDDASGVHYVVFQAALEARENAFATVDLFPSMLRIRGVGQLPSRDLMFS